MIRINLIPKEIEQKAAARRKTFKIVGIAVTVISIFLGLYLMRVSKLSSLRGEIEEVEQELSEIESVVKKVKSIKKRKAELDKKINVIKGLMESRLLYPVFMEDIAEILPSGVWLTNLNTHTEDLSLKLNMEVKAINNYTSADFINALEKSDKFTEIQFPGINTAVSEDGTEIRTFNLTCRYETSTGVKD